ncbi:MAG TPA: DUF5668 domain-containing protein [Terriglobia bacterium]|nr:DUF5668 domain-containing protein [Terriglobia bacterium]
MATNINSAQDRHELRRARRIHGIGLAGPILLVTLGVLFLMGEFVPYWGVGKTWPVLLIVFGLARLIESAWAGGSPPSR